MLSRRCTVGRVLRCRFLLQTPRLRLAARLNNHLGVADQEQGAPVWVCSQLRAAWAAIWPRLRDFG